MGPLPGTTRNNTGKAEAPTVMSYASTPSSEENSSWVLDAPSAVPLKKRPKSSMATRTPFAFSPCYTAALMTLRCRRTVRE